VDVGYASGLRDVARLYQAPYDGHKVARNMLS